jgi:hypothetical protein
MSSYTPVRSIDASRPSTSFTCSRKAAWQFHRVDQRLRLPQLVAWDLGIGAAVCLLIAFASLLIASIFYKIVSHETAGVTP